MTHWVPVLFVGVVVVCVTGYLLLEPKFRQSNREGQKSNRARRPF
jgi:Ni,Fe-hydrogenase I cytochrome b subunit